MKKYILILALLASISASAQKTSSAIKGRVYNAKNNEPVEFATVVIQNSTNGTNSDLNGNFLLKQVEPGFYQLKISGQRSQDFLYYFYEQMLNYYLA